MKRVTICLAVLVSMMCTASTANAAIISYWNENTAALPSGPTVFGYVPGYFPEPANVGNGTLNLANFETTTAPPDGAYTTIASFGGTTTNAQNGDPAGGSLSPTGGAGTDNNGMQILLSLSTVGYTDINLSWAQRGTATGFTSRAFAYSTDGGANFTPVAYVGDSLALSATFTTVSPVLTGITALENNANVVFRITLGGATNSSGNNRFDNILVQGVQVPEPACFGLLAMAGLVTMARGRKR